MIVIAVFVVHELVVCFWRAFEYHHSILCHVCFVLTGFLTYVFYYCMGLFVLGKRSDRCLNLDSSLAHVLLPWCIVK